ncbi:MAG: CIA30 family protein [Chthoniobacterales bacterium]
MKNIFKRSAISSLVLATAFVGNADCEEGRIEFGDGDDRASWSAMTDRVMGGVSTGESEVAGGNLIFTGEVSLENNGGFSLVETTDGEFDFSGASAMRLRVKGDGRPYVLRLATDARHRGDRVQYGAGFETEEGEWTEVVVPFDEMTPSHHGETVDAPPLNLAGIEQIGVMTGGKDPGPFELEIDWMQPE